MSTNPKMKATPVMSLSSKTTTTVNMNRMKTNPSQLFKLAAKINKFPSRVASK
jgi:hypothetical protein